MSVPSTATINGIAVEVRRRTRDASGVTIAGREVKLIEGPVLLTASRASPPPWTRTRAYVTYDGPTDLWGRLWTPADLNDPTLGVAVSTRGIGATGGDEARVDHVRLTVYYASACCVPTTCAAKGYSCGSLYDGCSKTLSCGTCSQIQNDDPGGECPGGHECLNGGCK